MMPTRPPASPIDFLAGGGEMGERIRAHEWKRTPLGPIAAWPQSLRTAVSIMLNSKFPTYMAWGPDLTSLYNNAYRPILGIKPEALGRPFAEVWSEAWDILGPIAERAMAGAASYFENLPLTLNRKGYDERTWWTFSYSPIRDESGGVGGIICTVYETTQEVKARAALRAEKDRLQSLFEQAPGMMVMLNGPEHVFELANATYRELVGDRDLIGKPAREALPELEGQGYFDILDQVYQTGSPFVGRQMPITLQRRPGAAPETRYFDFVYQPITDNEGRVIGIFGQGHDVTDLKRAEIALRESESRLRLALDAGRMAVWASDTGTDTIITSPELNRLLGFPADASPTAREIRARFAPGARERLQAAVAAALGRGEHYAEEELEVIRPDGTHRWLMLRAELEARAGPDGGVQVRATGVALDITNRKQLEKAQRLLVNELNHRVKNTLTTVQAIAAQSFRNMGEESRDKLKTFEDRLFALARAHDLLTRESWEGAELHEVITEGLAPYMQQRERFEIDGPRLRLIPSTALAVAIAINELATNAVKFGALSVPTGRVSIGWCTTENDPPLFVLRWDEYGGPPVVPPSRKGFGTRLIERTLASDLSGEVQLKYEPSGLVCVIKAPLVSLTGTATPRSTIFKINQSEALGAPHVIFSRSLHRPDL